MGHRVLKSLQDGPRIDWIFPVFCQPLPFSTTQEVIPVAEFILMQMVGAIFYTWGYNNTNLTVFLAILLHALWNVFGGLIPHWVTSEGRWVNFGVELVVAAALVFIYGARTLAKGRTQAPTV